MTRVIVLAVSITLLGLTACTSLEDRERANGEFDYVNAKLNEPFKVPEGLDKPEYNRQYEIPSVGENAPSELVGKKVTVVAPALVLPLVTGSHVEEGKKEAIVYFDQVDDSKPLDETIWNSLIGFLEDRGIAVISFDKQKQTLVTDWMIIETDEENGWFNWTSTERSIGRRFEFQLDVKSHGRTAALHTRLKDYLETVGDEVIGDINSEQERRNEVEILNEVISHYEKQMRLADMQRIRQIRSGFPMELGFNSDGDPAYVVDGDYDLVWPRFLLVLRKLGFNVKDLDQTNGLLFVTYGTADTGWWDSLVGNDDDELDLEKTDYRFKVTKQGAKTVITLMDNDSKPFDVAKVTDLFAPFSRVMTTENLDI